MNLLLLEDNDTITKALTYLLNQNDFNVTAFSNLKSILEERIEQYDLLILDITLPDGNGIDFYKKVKDKNVPVIFLTAKDDEENILECFDLGCADYITKPFKTGELLARIKRITNKKNNQIVVKNVILDMDKMMVTKDNIEISLSSLEYRILLLLFNNIDRITTRDFILNQIWDSSENFVEDNTLTVYIKRLRSKIGDDIIKTVKGIGYRVDSK